MASMSCDAPVIMGDLSQATSTLQDPTVLHINEITLPSDFRIKTHHPRLVDLETLVTSLHFTCNEGCGM